MKSIGIALSFLVVAACNQPPPSAEAAGSTKGSTEVTSAPAEATHPPVDPTNIVSIAGGSKDHSTLVAALKSADYLDALSNPGPFTVFAPTNGAFEKLPPGTVDSLLKPESRNALNTVLQHHVTVSTYALRDLHDGQVLSMVDGGKVTVHVKNGKTSINDANVVASIPASNGIVHVIDAVLVPAK
jgi:uncharacterized surface protein with fasciclin (FAS1) repeats